MLGCAGLGAAVSVRAPGIRGIDAKPLVSNTSKCWPMSSPWQSNDSQNRNLVKVGKDGVNNTECYVPFSVGTQFDGCNQAGIPYFPVGLLLGQVKMAILESRLRAVKGSAPVYYPGHACPWRGNTQCPWGLWRPPVNVVCRRVGEGVVDKDENVVL